MSSGIADLPKPVLGAAYDSVLALKIAVFEHFLKNQAEPTILSSDHNGARLRCRLRSDTTVDKIGEGTPCTSLIKAGRAAPDSALRIIEFNPNHSCPASVRHERNRSDESVGSVYIRGKLEVFGRMLEAEKRRQHHSPQSAQALEQERETPSPELSANGRPIRSSAQDVHYTFAPSLLPQRAAPAIARSSSSSTSKYITSPVGAKVVKKSITSPVKATLVERIIGQKRVRGKEIRRLSAPALSVASTSRSVPPQKPRSSEPTASRYVTSNSGALDPAPLRAKPLRTGGVSTVFLQATPKQTSPSSTPSAPPSTISRSTQSGPVRQFLATTSLPPTQRDVLAGALESAGVFEAEDLVKVLFFHNDILKDFGRWLGGAESWPADARFRTIGEALHAVVEGARVVANLGKSS